MVYEEFLSRIKDELKSCFCEEEHKIVTVKKVLKNNGVELDALTVMESTCKASPTIYLNRYYDEYMSGRTISSIREEIYQLIVQNSGKISFDLNDFCDFERVKKSIVFKVVNAEKNKKMLAQVPHIKVLDLAMVFYVMVHCKADETATTMIYNQHLEMWNVGEEEVYNQAVKNTPLMLPYELKSMGDIIKEMLNEADFMGEVHEDTCYGGEEAGVLADQIMEELTSNDENPQMFVLTNKIRINGAAAMLYPDVLKNFSKEKNADLILLPSSVHEIIIIPMEDGMKMEDFKSMICEVNNEEVEDSDILSDHAYLYRRDSDKIEM